MKANWLWICLSVGAIWFLIAVIQFANAQPPAGVDLASPESQWYQSLKQPKTGIGCCSISDCRPVDADMDDKGNFKAHIDSQWVSIPPDKVLMERNPTGKPVVCYTIYWPTPKVEQFNILCFVPGTMI